MLYVVTHVRVANPFPMPRDIVAVRVKAFKNNTIHEATPQQVIDCIKQGDEFRSRELMGPQVQAVTAADGTQYIRTAPNDTRIDNLLTLPTF